MPITWTVFPFSLESRRGNTWPAHSTPLGRDTEHIDASQCLSTHVIGAVSACVCFFFFPGVCVRAYHPSLLFMLTNQRRSVHMCARNIWFCVAWRNLAFLSSVITYRQGGGGRNALHTHVDTHTHIEFCFLPKL